MKIPSTALKVIVWCGIVIYFLAEDLMMNFQSWRRRTGLRLWIFSDVKEPKSEQE